MAALFGLSERGVIKVAYALERDAAPPLLWRQVIHLFLCDQRAVLRAAAKEHPQSLCVARLKLGLSLMEFSLPLSVPLAEVVTLERKERMPSWQKGRRRLPRALQNILVLLETQREFAVKELIAFAQRTTDDSPEPDRLTDIATKLGVP